MSRFTLLFACLLSTACSGEFWRGCTSAVVGKTVETTKEVTTGVAEGLEEGRKRGTSVDGATLVSKFADFDGIGGASVYSIDALDGSAAKVVIALENTSDHPLRVSGMSVTALDKEGFVKKPEQEARSPITVPPRAKEQVELIFPLMADQVGAVRLWDNDLSMP